MHDDNTRDAPQAIRVHPAAALFPLIEGDEFDALVADIKANGLRESIKLYDGQVLDGRNRDRACEAAGIEPTFEDLTGKIADPIAYVLSLNLRRRHLDVGSRAVIAESLATLKLGTNQFETRAEGASPDTPPVLSIEQAAKLLDVSPRAVNKARFVMQHVPELVDALKSGAISLEDAYNRATKARDAKRQQHNAKPITVEQLVAAEQERQRQIDIETLRDAVDQALGACGYFANNSPDDLAGPLGLDLNARRGTPSFFCNPKLLSDATERGCQRLLEFIRRHKVYDYKANKIRCGACDGEGGRCRHCGGRGWVPA